MSVNLNLSEILTIRLRRDTSANWESTNPILKIGEPGLETDTRKLKFGDGVTAWTSLSYTRSDSNDPLLLESVDDRVASLIKAGSNISLNYNDSANELTVSATGLQLAGDYATLISGRVPAAQLPSYVDDVIEANNFAALPVSGETGKIYVTLDSNKVYRWSGSVYIEISPSPGSTDSVIEGSTNLYYTNSRASAAAPVQSVAGKTGTVTLAKSDVGLGNVDNTSDVNKPVSTATQTALNSKAPLASPTFTGTVNGITKSMVGLGNVDNTSDANKPISSATQTALDGKASSVHTHSSNDISDATSFGKNILKAASYANINNLLWEIPAVSGGPPTFTAANGGHYYIPPSLLPFIKFNDPPISGDFYRVCSFDSDSTLNIGNISYTNSGGIDIVRVYSSITTSWETIRFNNHTHAINNISELQTALDAKAPLASPTFTGTVGGITSNMVGLGNVDNTSDANKPISTAQQTALDGKASSNHNHVIGDVTGLQTALDSKQASGNYATLTDGKIPSSQLPSYVDDVIEVANLATLPVSGETSKIYVTLDSNKVYRWSGSAYVEISPSPGSTDSITEGSVNLYYTNSRASAAAPVQSVNGSTGIVTIDRLVKDDKTVILGSNGSVTLPSGSILSETNNTLSLMPPTAVDGQSLVIRATNPTGITSDHSGGFTAGDTITITITPDNGNVVTGTVDYTFTGDFGIGELGNATTGTLTFTSQANQTLTWTVPVESGMTTFIFTLSNAAGFGIGGLTALTLTGTGSSEDSHIHLISGDPTTVDIYLGDDDQYIKIEKNAGDVVIGTNSDTNHWTFGTDGSLTLPQGGVIDETLSVDTLTLVGAGLVAVNQTYIKTSPTLYTGSNGVTIVALGDGVWFCIQDNDTKYSSTDNLTTWDNSTGGLPVPTSTVNPGVDTVNITVGTETWTFGQDGMLTFPGGDISIGTITQYGQATPAIIASPDMSIGMVTSGASGSVALQWVEDINTPINGAGVVVNPYNNTGTVQIMSSSSQWTFGADGNLTFPDGSVQTTAPTVIDVVQGSGVSVTSSGGTFTVGVSGLNASYISDFNSSVDDRVGDLLIAGDNINLDYITDPASLTVSIDPTFLNTSLVAGSGINLNYADDELTVSVSGLDASYISDFSSAVSTATQTALNSKAPLASPTFTGTVNGITNSMVGLGNVDNTSDANKPISTAQQTALDGKASSNHNHVIGDVTGLQTALDSKQASGNYATLTDGKVPSSQLPSYVDDVIEVANLAALPVSGETSKIYITLDSNKVYRWSGSAYVEISPSPGSTDSVIEGSTNLYYTNSRASAAAPVQSVAGKTGTVTLAKSDVGLGNVDNTSDANKPISSTTQTALDGKASSVHTHTSSNISDFNESVNDRVGDLLIAGDNISLEYIDSPASLTVSIVPTFLNTSLIAGSGISLDYANSELTVKVSGLNSSYISNFSSAVSGLLPVKNIVQGSGVSVTSSNGIFTINADSITKSMVGLGNVDNTSDANKPVSTAQQTALDGKASSSHNHAISDVTGLQTALDNTGSSPDAGFINKLQIATTAPTVVSTTLNYTGPSAVGFQSKYLNFTSPPTSGLNGKWKYERLAGAYASLTGVTISGTGGQFSCTAQNGLFLRVGQQLTIGGTNGGTGTITGYTTPTTYLISATNGATTFTLTTVTGAAIVTTAGTLTALTYTLRDYLATNVAVTDTSGGLSCAITSLRVGQTLRVAGTSSGTGSIAAGDYFISETNGSTTFRVINQNTGFTPVTTVAGTTTGLTFSILERMNFSSFNPYYPTVITGQAIADYADAPKIKKKNLKTLWAVITPHHTMTMTTGSLLGYLFFNLYTFDNATGSPLTYTNRFDYLCTKAVENFSNEVTTNLQGGHKYLIYAKDSSKYLPNMADVNTPVYAGSTFPSQLTTEMLKDPYDMYTDIPHIPFVYHTVKSPTINVIRITGTDGTFNCNPLYIAGGTTSYLADGQLVMILGAFTNGIIVSPPFTAGNLYIIDGTPTIESNGTVTFKLKTLVGDPLVTTLTTTTLSSVVITGTAGQFSCASTFLKVGQTVTISGTLGGTGSITGYSSPTTYVIGVTNGTTTGTLLTTAGAAIATTAGTPTGLTYTSGHAGTAALAFYVNPPDPNNTYVSQMTLSTSTTSPGIPLGITVDSMGYSGTADDSSEVNVKLDLVY